MASTAMMDRCWCYTPVVCFVHAANVSYRCSDCVVFLSCISAAIVDDCGRPKVRDQVHARNAHTLAHDTHTTRACAQTCTCTQTRTHMCMRTHVRHTLDTHAHTRYRGIHTVLLRCVGASKSARIVHRASTCRTQNRAKSTFFIFFIVALFSCGHLRRRGARRPT